VSPQRAICGVDSSQLVGKGVEKNPHAGACEASTANGFRSFLLAYDDSGNLIQKGGTLFEYDPENHLVRVRVAHSNGASPPKLLAENVYDAAGQRVIHETRDDTTVYIDEIYEENKTHASRHVRAGPLLVATITTPLTAVRLVDEAPPALYGLEGAGSDGFQITMAGHWPWLLMSFTPFAAIGFFRTPGRRRRLRRCLATLAENASEMRQQPFKVALILLLVPVYLVTSVPQVLADTGTAGTGEYPPSEARYYYHSNHLGSVNLVTDDHGKVIERRDYKPYGDRFHWAGPHSGPRELPYTFNGHRFDDTTGLYYFGARHYDSEIGRFITADTQVPDPMNPKTLNRYAFAGGNPINYQDPTGHAWWDWILAIFVVVVLLVIGIVTAGIGFAAFAGAVSGAWVMLGVGGALAGATLLILGGAALGAGIMGIAYMANEGMDSFTWNGFAKSLAAGAIIGAAVGAALVALPYSLGFGLGFTGGWAVGLAADFLLGAALGGLAAAIGSGSAPDELLGVLLGEEMVTSMLKGGLFGLAVGLVLAVGLGAEAIHLAAVVTISALFTGEAIAEVAGGGTIPGTNISFGNMFGTDPNWFRNSPLKALGIPHWAFKGSWLGFGPNRSDGNLAPLLQTMPLAP
jgi:RHS repeat-associated protein